MSNLIITLALTAAAGADITATKLDGTTLSGQLQSWQDDRISLVLSAGEMEFAEAELLTVQFAPASPKGTPRPLLELVDGTVLPVVAFQTDGSQAVAEMDRPAHSSPQVDGSHTAEPHAAEQRTSEAEAISIPFRQVRSVRLQALDESAVAQWHEIRAISVPGDLLIVSKRGGQSLDYLEGIIGRVSDREVEFKIDDKTVRVARDKVAGLVFYRAAAPSDEPPHCVLLGPNDLRISAAALHLKGDELYVTTSAGVELTWPLIGIHTADFSAGKVVYLSDLEPAAQSWQPLVGLPTTASLALQFGKPRFDRSASGGKPELSFLDDGPPDSGSSGARHIKTFAKGLSLRGRTELVYRLPSGYNRFMTMAGIDPTTRVTGQVHVAFFGDDRLLAEMSVAGEDAPLPIELEIAGVKRLKIIVDYGPNLDTGDWLNLCNARIVQ